VEARNSNTLFRKAAFIRFDAKIIFFLMTFHWKRYSGSGSGRIQTLMIGSGSGYWSLQSAQS
jgi:hypothetical protein